ncbi:hypothetical protein ADK67_44460 [Saccharothrix sp. NRRL B-16348]|uniref:DUF5946 family protein n=1 Tax=Saccharothrix sp. NRRL B-16348 TaxID=1415542 RepID=UPI0006ADF453|nr:DUF5946 family protein [Saccharothrix sp. NRRL B-16348]KOX13285.1 hypothetical protein ADK67_44460 [Saccharothrix sp. NRRL B-16348]
MTRCPECGAPARPLSCEELFHVVLALDHSRRPPWGPLHGVTVSCFLLQHPSRLPAHDRARPWATLHAYLDGGLDAATRFTEGMRRANSHRGAGLAEIVAGAPLGPPPTAFTVTIGDVAEDGTFPAAGFPERVEAWAAATVAAWRS